MTVEMAQRQAEAHAAKEAQKQEERAEFREAAILAAFQGLMANPSEDGTDERAFALCAVKFADALVDRVYPKGQP